MDDIKSGYRGNGVKPSFQCKDPSHVSFHSADGWCIIQESAEKVP